jgi:cardiolipin synthase
VRLLYDPGNKDGAEPTFARVVELLDAVQNSVSIHMYVWRNDRIGNRIGRAVLDAADRGVRITIIKDAGAVMYEQIEMNRKSFFNLPVSRRKALKYRLLRPTFPDTFVEDDYDFDLGRRVMQHPNVTFEWVNHTHTKYYLFDEHVLVTGSINIEDRHRTYNDYMLEIEGESVIRHFRSRQTGASPELGRRTDFVFNHPGRFEIKPLILRLLEETSDSLYVEMAYIGDEGVSRSIIETANRGVDVTFLFSREANIGNDINYRTMHYIACRAPVKVYFTDRMIHSKMMRFDDKVILMGSANLSVFSLCKAEEMDVVLHDHPDLFADFDRVIQQRIGSSVLVETPGELSKYNRPVAWLQQLHQKLNPR